MRSAVDTFGKGRMHARLNWIWQRSKSAIAWLVLHVSLAAVWVLLCLIFVPVSWFMLNGVLWDAGYGHVLVKRPVAAVLHRMMGSMQAFENHSEAISYYEGHLKCYPDATAEDREHWRSQLDATRAGRNILLAKAAGLALTGYVVVAGLFELWLRRGGSDGALVSEGASGA